jgi:DNA polymerase-3 subunit epsilon
MILLDRTIVVTDTETTGLRAASDRLIEIGAIRLAHGEEPISFSRLIDPGVSIPYRITRLTGITSAMVFGCPDASQVMPEFDAFLGEGVLVAHNLSFDRGFIDAERDRLGLAPMPNDGLCTVRLARRLLPGLRSKSLDSLARFFGIAVRGRHRALQDVEVTVEVLRRLMEIAEREHGVASLDELMSMQTRTYARVNPFSQHILRIRRDVLPQVPESPGVYRMLDGRGRVLYVGKAKVLSRRVRSYFNAIEAHPPRIRQLVSRLRDIEWTHTPTELEALLLESRQIAELDPPVNRAQKRTVPRPYLRIATDTPFPRVVANVFPRNDGAEYYGPLRSRSEARALLDIIERFFAVRTCDEREFAGGRRCLRADIGRCGAPCENGMTPQEYAGVLEGVRGFLAGDVERIVEHLREDMISASVALSFEEAARLRDLIRVVEERMERHDRIAPRIFEEDAVILHADTETGAREILLVRAGRLVGSLAAYQPGKEAVLRRLDREITRIYESESVPRGDALREDANAIRVMTQWLYARRAFIRRIPRDSTRDPEAFVRQIDSEADAFFSSLAL